MTGPIPDQILQHHLASLKKQGATQAELDDYVAEWDAAHTPHEIPAENVGKTLENGVEVARTPAGVAPRQESGLEHAVGAARAVNKGLTLGFNDELSGLAAAAGNALTLKGDLVGAYRKARNAERGNQATYAENHPAENVAAQLVGGSIPTLATFGASVPGNAAVVAPGLIRSVASGAASGGLVGGISGLGEGEGNLNNQLDSVKRQALMGVILGGAAPVAGRLVSRMRRGSRTNQLLEEIRGRLENPGGDGPASITMRQALERDAGKPLPVMPKRSSGIIPINAGGRGGTWTPELPETPAPIPPAPAPVPEAPVPPMGPSAAETARRIQAATSGGGRSALTPADLISSPPATPLRVLPDGQRGWGPGLSGRGGWETAAQPMPTDPNDLEATLAASLDQLKQGRRAGSLAPKASAVLAALAAYQANHRR